MVTTSIGRYGAALDGVIQPDGKLVAAGFSIDDNGRQATLARYLGDTPDPNTPNTTLVGGPSGPTNVTAPSFTFTASLPGSTFECKLDTPAGAGSYAPCTSPHQYTATANGGYTFSVRAISAGNTDAFPATRTFTIDTVPPETTILTGPGAVTNDRFPEFTFSSSEPDSTFECRVDQVQQPSSFEPCTTPHEPGPLPNGDEYYFLVLATDAAGNRDQSVAASGLFTVAAARRG